MRLLVKEEHNGYGVFPLFKKGAAIRNLSPCNEYPHWFSCIINDYETFIPETYVIDGILIKDYNPTELIVKNKQIVILEEIVFEWLYVRDENGKSGWLPASKIISI